MRNALTFCLLLFVLNFYAQKDVTVPDVSNFDSSVGSQTSVNLSNGKLNVPLKLVSLKGYKDLSVQFGIAYSGAQIASHSKASNEVIPTGVLGLGWGMQMPRILADNKLTAARDDDQFYMFSDGSLNELIATNKTPTKIEFKSKVFKPWKITFYPDQELWEIVKENGYKYTYAYVDWVLYWDNWIGNSNQPCSGRQGSGWSLTSVEDLYGNQINYDYFSVTQNLSGDLNPLMQQTEATYLSSITGSMGERIEFIYDEKNSNEYYEPNTNANEPDAYQEIYETKYLKSVEAYDTENQFLYKYDMNYITIGQDEYTKRLLNKIEFRNANNDIQIYREFQYNTDSTSELYGHLEHQILPTKGRISYQYDVKEIEIDQVFDITGNNHSSFVVQENYIVKCTYLVSGGNKYVYLTRYDWDGKTWREEDLGILPGINSYEGYLDLQILARDNFFVILYRVNGANYYRRAYGLNDDGVTWNDISKGVFHVPAAGNNAVQLMGGEDFYVIGNPKQDRINMYRWNGETWEQFYQYNNTPGTYYYTASNNYVIQHNKDTGIDTIKMFYYDITNNVQQIDFTASININTSNSGNYASYWYGSHSFAQVNANANPEYVIRWDKDYNFLTKDVVSYGSIPDNSKTYSLFNNMFFATYKIEGGTYDSRFKFHANRYMGNGQWAALNSESSSIRKMTVSGFGSDLIIYPKDEQYSSPSHLGVFNANSGSWNEYFLPLVDSFEGATETYDVFAKRYAFAKNQLFKVKPDLSFISPPITIGMEENEEGFPVPIIFGDKSLLTKTDGKSLLYTRCAF